MPMIALNLLIKWGASRSIVKQQAHSVGIGLACDSTCSNGNFVV